MEGASMHAFHFGAMRTRGGFALDEVASALQKTIRRGEERQAIFWATELDLSGYGNYAWKRLRIICSEDLGLAWREGPAVIRALSDTWQDTRKAEKDRPPERSNAMLFLVHAVSLLARAPKSRLIDNACTIFYIGEREAMHIEVPDYAVDHHTGLGRKLGRTEQHVYDESYRIENCTIDDPYATEARTTAGQASPPTSA
jgi:replication-associated recombination protein RarA